VPRRDEDGVADRFAGTALPRRTASRWYWLDR
jgi:hypothetical protein